MLILQLSGCAVIDAIFMAPYDNNEYALVNKVRTLAETSDNCDASTVKELYLTTYQLKNYSQYLPRNSNQNNLNEDLFKLVDELYRKQSPSPVYCKSKLHIIKQSAERIQQVTGSKSR
jgi:hypothetical protein